MTIKDIVFEWFHEAIIEGKRFVGKNIFKVFLVLEC